MNSPSTINHLIHLPQFKLEIFEGPLDYLLHLIKKNELEITQIPVLEIIDQYTRYLKSLDEMNIEYAGEFILMASELAHIKSRLLIHEQKAEDNEANEEDPTYELIAKLKTYQKYQKLAEQLEQRPQQNREFTYRPQFGQALQTRKKMLLGKSLDLFFALENLNRKNKENPTLQLGFERLSVAEKIDEIKTFLENDWANGQKKQCLFDDLLFSVKTRSEVVITFLALLELVRLKKIRAIQNQLTGYLYIENYESD